MSRPSREKTGRALPEGTVDHGQAAELLRAARAAGLDTRNDSVEWALSMLPWNRHVRRLAIRRLLHAGNTDAADALIAQGLLIEPTDPVLTRLRAESLLMQGDTRLAEKEIALALEKRPRHCGTLTLAARIASARGDHPRAVALLRGAEAERPSSDAIKARLVRTLLDVDCPEEAEKTVRAMKCPTATLRARVRAARGRLLEAIDLLESARAENAWAGEADPPELLTELIDLLERAGHLARLRRLLVELTEQENTDRAVLARVGIAWLTQGAFTTATRLMGSLSGPGPGQRDALAVLVVAASMAGRRRLARRALHRLQETAAGADPAVMADLWRRALTARLFSDQYDPRKAGADRNASLLQPLLRSALEVFDRRRASLADAAGGEAEELNRHRAVCLAAMGRTREA
ncbi:MAG: hypothetical protein SYC29_15235, partial [Planctomycetota bacterium]|nr:hypothetical protein [Planctomycetota bacterium]